MALLIGSEKKMGPILQQVEQNNNRNRPRNLIPRNLFDYIFYLLCLAFLVGSLCVLGALFPNHNLHFHPLKWYPPLLTSIVISAILGFQWQWMTDFKPYTAIWVVFRLSPAFTSLLGVLILVAGFTTSPGIGSLVTGLLLLIFSIVQFLYGNWVKPHYHQATRILSLSKDYSPPQKNALLLRSLFMGILYSCCFVAGLGVAVKTTTNRINHYIFVSVILAIQFLFMLVIRNNLLVAVSGLSYIFCTTDCHDPKTIRIPMGSLCIGSILVPIFEFIYGSYRALRLLAGVNRRQCLSGLASKLIRLGNVWGFVRMGVENKGIFQVSNDTWDILMRHELEGSMGSSLAGPFCFFSGVTGGAICSLVSGAWTLVANKNDALQVSLYAFLIGYLMVRIGMAGPHAYVLAFFVADAANRQARINNTIPQQQEEPEEPEQPEQPEQPEEPEEAEEEGVAITDPQITIMSQLQLRENHFV